MLNVKTARPAFQLLLAGWVACFISMPAMAGVHIEHWTTANGAKVYFVAAPDLPIVDVNLVFDAGSARDGDHPGIGQLTANLIEDGTAALNADAVASKFEALGARFDTSSLIDMASVNLRSLSDPAHLQPSLDTLAAILKAPAFSENDLQRERRLQASRIKAEEESPEDIAQKLFMATLYGTHPYATDPLGTNATLDAISRDDVQAHYGKYYVAANAVIAIVGDLDTTHARQVAEQLSGALNAGTAPAPVAQAAPLAKAETQVRAFPSSQTHLLIGQPGMRRDDPDYIPLYVGNHILGGSGLVARISQEIREKRGLAYSAYSYFMPMRVDGPFTMGLQTRNEKADEARKLMIETLRTFIDKGPTEAELQASKQNITGGFPLRISSNKKIVGYLAMIGFYGLPLDYLDTFNDRVEAVTVAQIMDAFRRRIDPDRLVTIMVGGTAKPS